MSETRSNHRPIESLPAELRDPKLPHCVWGCRNQSPTSSTKVSPHRGLDEHLAQLYRVGPRRLSAALAAGHVSQRPYLGLVGGEVPSKLRVGPVGDVAAPCSRVRGLP